MSQLFQIVAWRSENTYDTPFPRASSDDELIAVIREAIKKPFTRIEIEDVSWWNSSKACSVTLTEDCPRLSDK